MLAKRPPLLSLDGLTEDEAIEQARATFTALFLSGPIIDVLERRVVFEGRDWEHVCFKEVDGHRNPYGQLPRSEWRADRAYRIPWILTALQAKETRVRPSSVRRQEDRQSYTIIVPADPPRRLPQEFFGVFVRTTSNPKEVRFITAYVMDQVTLDRVKNGGPLIYPPEKVKKKRKNEGGSLSTPALVFGRSNSPGGHHFFEPSQVFEIIYPIPLTPCNG